MRIWGFDLGTTSIGFAVIEHDPERRAGSILRLGVRIFPEGRDNDLDPKNKTRRMKRLARRQFRRRRLRRRLLNEALHEAGLLPPFGSQQWKEVMTLDPYPLRVKALAEPLSPFELGRTIYHQTKRRHFRDRDYGVDDEEHVDKKDADEQKAQEGREALVGALKKSGQTLGAHLAAREKKRGHHATRTVVDEEFNRIWAAQSRHHQKLGDPSFRERIQDIVFSQRPTFWRLSTLRPCPLEPGEPCPKSYWLSQQRRMLEIVNNLRFAGGNARNLTPDERKVILDALAGKESLTFGEARKALRRLWQTTGDEPLKAKFNLETSKGDDKIAKLKGNKVDTEFAAALGDGWEGHPQIDRLRKELPTRIWQTDYLRIGNKKIEIRTEPERRALRAELTQALRRDFELTDAQASALAQIKLPTGWDRFSAGAIERMLPLLESGVPLGKLVSSTDPEWARWREETFPRRERPTGEVLDKLPSRSDLMPQVRNPTVTRVLNELRKVVNNLLDFYDGRKPDLIRIELARQVGKPKKVREAIDQANRERERERKKVIKELEANGANPSEDNITKWLLWEECNHQCPYSGRHICFDDLFRTGEFDIEHIWPLSVSYDNSWTNKTLCHREENIRKNKRIPYAAYSGDEENWDELKRRLDSIGLPENKKKRFLATEISEGFINRQLNDTGWAARAACDFLARLWPDEGPEKPAPVEPVNGMVTAQLRKRWELNFLLGDTGKKNRADHRHHAVDALAVACTASPFVKRLSDYYKAEEERREPYLPKPWSTIRKDAELALQRVVVSHRTRRKVSGELHDQTVMGRTDEERKSRGVTYRLYVTRTPVELLSKSDLDDDEIIRDGGIRGILRRHVAERSGDPKKAFPPYPRLPGPNGTQGPEIRRVRLFVKKQPNLMERVGTGYAFAAANHHMAIFRLADGTIDADVVSLHQAARRVASHEPVVSKKKENGATFIMALSPGDTLAFPNGDGSIRYRIAQSIWANKQVVLLDHTDASKDNVSKNQPMVASIIASGAQKVSVDPIGRVRPARD